MKTVADLSAGHKAILLNVRANVVGAKLIELGCLPGSEIILVRTGFAKTTYYIKINGSRFALRKSEAECLEISMNNQ